MIKVYNGTSWQKIENDLLVIAKELHRNPNLEYLEVNFPHAMGYSKYKLEIEEMNFILTDGDDMVAAFGMDEV